MKDRLRGYKQWIMGIVLAIAFAMVFNQFGVVLSVVSGSSMNPTLHDGDRLLVNKLKFLIGTPQRGDVVTFKDPTDPDRYLVKRVVGIPGDRLEIIDGVLYRNQEKVTEKYINTSIEDGNFGPVVVEPNTVFVMGDNRHRYASRDSRYDNVGMVPYSLLSGKVEMILWRPSLANSL